LKTKLIRKKMLRPIQL